MTSVTPEGHGTVCEGCFLSRSNLNRQNRLLHSRKALVRNDIKQAIGLSRIDVIYLVEAQQNVQWGRVVYPNLA